MRQVKIYTLSGPKGVRYVGKTSKSLKKRLKGHIYSKSSDHRGNWIKSLRAKGIKPTIEILDIVDEDVWQEMEIYWIRQFKDWGFDLVNTQLGGGTDGSHNHKSVQQLDKYTGEVLATFESIIGASAALGVGSAGISAVCTGKVKTAGGFAWKHKDDDSYIFTAFYDQSVKGNSKSVQKLDRYTGSVLKTFKSISAASREEGILHSGITRSCASKTRSAGGYKWKYADDEDYIFTPFKVRSCTRSCDRPARDWYTKCVQQLDKNTGGIISTFESTVDASKVTNVGRSNIANVLAGKNKTAGGFAWKLVNDEDYIFTPYVKPRTSSVQKLDIVTGEVLDTFESLTIAGEAIGVGGISAVCRGKNKSAGGYKWRYTPTN